MADYFSKRHIPVKDVETLPKLFTKYWDLLNERLTAENNFNYPEVDGVTVIESMARSLGGRLNRSECAEALKIMRKSSIESISLFDGAVELLETLRERGKKVYLLSNAQSVVTREEIDEFALLPHFDGIVLSSEEGCKKPDKAFFEILFDRYDIDKSTAVMIGDDMRNDVRGAEAFGIAAVWAGGGVGKHRDEIIGLI